MTRMFVTAALAAVAIPIGAQTPLPDVDRLGPQVGDAVPPFSLPDQTGERQDLASLTGPNGLMLVFSRSADW